MLCHWLLSFTTDKYLTNIGIYLHINNITIVQSIWPVLFLLCKVDGFLIMQTSFVQQYFHIKKERTLHSYESGWENTEYSLMFLWITQPLTAAFHTDPHLCCPLVATKQKVLCNFKTLLFKCAPLRN